MKKTFETYCSVSYENYFEIGNPFQKYMNI